MFWAVLHRLVTSDIQSRTDRCVPWPLKVVVSIGYLCTGDAPSKMDLGRLSFPTTLHDIIGMVRGYGKIFMDCEHESVIIELNNSVKQSLPLGQPIGRELLITSISIGDRFKL